MASSRPSMATLSFEETTVRLHPSDTRTDQAARRRLCCLIIRFHERGTTIFSDATCTVLYIQHTEEAIAIGAAPQGRQHVYYLHLDETTIRTLTAPHPSSPVSRCRLSPEPARNAAMCPPRSSFGFFCHSHVTVSRSVRSAHASSRSDRDPDRTGSNMCSVCGRVS